MATRPLIAIIGTTASGKSSLALQLAEQYNGEIIAADSRTVYKDMDIGTAKPSVQEQARVPHHLIDVVTPDEPFTVADFKAQAVKAVKDIQNRGKLPILVGGTGLYVDSVLYDFQFRPVNAAKRAQLEKLSVEELQQQVQQQNLELPVNNRNPRHLIRTLESAGVASQRSALRPNALLLGLDLPKELIEKRIVERVDAMFADGFIDEARTVAEKYGWDARALQAPGYKAARDYVEGELSLGAAKKMFVRNDLQLAKRQRTWFKRNPDITWCSSAEQAITTVEAFLTTKDRH